MVDHSDRAPWPERRRDLAFAVGLLLALGGSYVAINEAFRDHTFCNALGCIDTRHPEDIWLGAVVCVIGVLVMVRTYRRRTDEPS